MAAFPKSFADKCYFADKSETFFIHDVIENFLFSNIYSACSIFSQKLLFYFLQFSLCIYFSIIFNSSLSFTPNSLARR